MLKKSVLRTRSDWAEIDHLPTFAAVIWVMLRSERWGLEAISDVDHQSVIAQAERVRCRTPDPMNAKIPYQEAESKIICDIISNALAVYVKEINGCIREVDEDWLGDLFLLDVTNNKIIDRDGRVTYRDAVLCKDQLLSLYEPRDAVAERIFNRVVWDVNMVTFWARLRTWHGFYDLDKTLLAKDFSRVDEALRRGELQAVVDGCILSREYWFCNEIASHPSARFEAETVRKVFPVHENPSEIDEIESFVSALPSHLSQRQAISQAKKAFPKYSKAVERLISENPRFPPRPRGRPSGAKSVKGRSVA